jgi:high-affinity iron transporter
VADLAERLDTLTGRLDAAGSGGPVAEAGLVDDEVKAILAAFAALAPAAWLKADSKADFDVIASALDQMQGAVAAGDYSLAESARLEAYAILESGPEAKLVAFAPQHKPILEGLFWYGDAERPGLARLLQDQAEPAQVQAVRAELDGALLAASAALSGVSSPTAVATSAGIIVLREGLEAVLILAALMASLKPGAMRRFRKPLWLGAGLALAATALTWALAHGLLQTMARYGERLEAVMSVAAVAVLLVVTNWFFHKAYWVDWLSGFHEKKGQLLDGPVGRWQLAGLVTLGFTSIYREGFETVLFAQALVLEAGLRVVLTGVLVGLVAVGTVGVLVFVMQARLPHRRMMIVTAFLIGAVLVTMVGSTAHVLQVVGWLSIHPIRALELPYWAGQWFGLYPTWEGLGLQAAAAAFALGSYVLAEQLKHRRVRAAVAARQQALAGGGSGAAAVGGGA